jgi:hypothetical protein
MHPTTFCYTAEANPSAPGGIAAIYRDLAADGTRTAQVTADVCAALARGPHSLVLTQWTAHLDRLADSLRNAGHDLVVLRGGMRAKARAAALARFDYQPGQPPLLAIATGSCIGGASTALHWTLCSWPPPSPSKGASSSTPGGSCGLSPANHR